MNHNRFSGLNNFLDRLLVRKHWTEGKPQYWRADTYEAEREFTSQLKQIQSDRPNDPPREWQDFWEMEPERTADRGLARRTAPLNRLFPPSVYPATGDDQAHRWPADPTEWASFVASKDVYITSDLDFRGGQTRGFAYCGVRSRVPIAEELKLELERKPRVMRVDGHDVVSKRPAAFGGSIWIFERDEYFFRYYEIALESTRGDV
jgi:hypothetical protein